MSIQSQNIALAEGAKAYVREVAEAMAIANVEPRFDVRFEGFGSGGFPGVPAEAALRYLTDLVSEQDPHYRYHTRIRHITVAVRVSDKDFA